MAVASGQTGRLEAFLLPPSQHTTSVRPVMSHWPNGRDKVLDRAQRHHLPGDFRESLRAVFDRDVAVEIELHDVTGVVPPIVGRFEDARALHPEVSKATRNRPAS